MSDSENEFTLTPEDVSTRANIAINNILPEKSKFQYEKIFDKFIECVLVKMFLTRGLLNQYCAGVAACIIMVCCASNNAWMTPLLSYFQGPDSEIPMTAHETSLLVSIISICSVLSSIPIAFLCNHIGRKPILLALGPVFIITWLLILYFPSVLMLWVARIVQGFAMGAAYTVTPIYLGEISGKSSRGTITSLYSNAYYLGLILTYAAGSCLSYRPFTFFVMALNVPFILLFIWQPESPYYYVMIGNTKEALDTLAWFTVLPHENLKDELKEIQLSLETRESYINVLTNSVNRKGLIILFALNMLKTFSGVVTFETYATQIFKLTPNSLIPPDMVTIVFGIVLLAGSCVGSCATDTFGRRSLLMVSSVGAMICQFLAGLYYFFLLKTSVQVASVGWVAVMLIMAASGLITAGIYPVCCAYTSELFTPSTRSVASSIGCIINSGLIFLSLLVYQPFLDYFGLYMNFYTYFLFLALGAVYLYKTAPETKGKSFAQIRNELNEKTFIQPTLEP